MERGVVALLALHLAVQIVFPLRHHLYPGDVAWTEEGHRFSWRMKLRSKSHDLSLFVTDPTTGMTWKVDPRDYLQGWQEGEVAGRPDMILQLAHHAAEDFRQRGYPTVEVRARALTSLNGRRKQDLIDPSVDLATRHRSVWPADWILPLNEPLRRGAMGSTS
jgi:vitamin K-dependent gamma-carboxylase